MECQTNRHLNICASTNSLWLYIVIQLVCALIQLELTLIELVRKVTQSEHRCFDVSARIWVRRKSKITFTHLNLYISINIGNHYLHIGVHQYTKFIIKVKACNLHSPVFLEEE